MRRVKERAQTSIGPIINHNPEAIIQAFLLSNELGSVKKVAKNLTVPLLSLGKKAHIINFTMMAKQAREKLMSNEIALLIVLSRD